MPSLSVFIRDQRTARGLSRDALAAAARTAAPAVVGLHRTAIERWENGVGGPDAGQLEALFRALGVTDEERLAVMRTAAGDPAPEATAGGVVPDEPDEPALQAGA